MFTHVSAKAYVGCAGRRTKVAQEGVRRLHREVNEGCVSEGCAEDRHAKLAQEEGV